MRDGSATLSTLTARRHVIPLPNRRRLFLTRRVAGSVQGNWACKRRDALPATSADSLSSLHALQAATRPSIQAFRRVIGRLNSACSLPLDIWTSSYKTDHTSSMYGFRRVTGRLNPTCSLTSNIRASSNKTDKKLSMYTSVGTRYLTPQQVLSTVYIGYKLQDQ